MRDEVRKRKYVQGGKLGGGKKNWERIENREGLIWDERGRGEIIGLLG